MTDYQALIGALAGNGIEFIIVGGAAATIHRTSTSSLRHSKGTNLVSAAPLPASRSDSTPRPFRRA